MSTRAFCSWNFHFIFAAFLFGATVFFLQCPPIASAEPTRESKESDFLFNPIEKFNEFVEEWKTHTKDVPETKEDVKKRMKVKGMEEEADSFLNKLDQHADNPEAALDELDGWLKQQREEKERQSDKTMDFRIFQTKVFFGGWMTFFIILAVLFALKFGFNIIRDSVWAIRNKILDLLGIQTRRTYEHYSPLRRQPDRQGKGLPEGPRH